MRGFGGTNNIINYTMKNQEKSGILVSFKMGRGGRYGNPGHVTYLGEYGINQYTGSDRLFINFENMQDLRYKFKNHPNLCALLDECNEVGCGAYCRLENWGFKLGEEIYTDCNGNGVGLTVAEAEKGIGCINYDNEYDKVWSMEIEECGVDEMEMIRNVGGYKSQALNEYLNEYFKEEIFMELCEKHNIPRSVNMHKILV